MERVYKVWGRVLFAFMFVAVPGSILAFVLLITGAVNNAEYVRLISLLLPLMPVGMFVWLLREMTLGEAMSKKYSVPRRNVSVTVDDLSADSILYRQGLRSGDVVVAANGESLESSTFPLQTWWQNQDSVTLTVLRDNQELQVAL